MKFLKGVEERIRLEMDGRGVGPRRFSFLLPGGMELREEMEIVY